MLHHNEITYIPAEDLMYGDSIHQYSKSQSLKGFYEVVQTRFVPGIREAFKKNESSVKCQVLE